MAQLFQDIFRPVVLTKVISQRVEATAHLLRRFGLQPGGPNEVNLGHGRLGAFHVFNNTLNTAAGAAPGTAAKRLAPQSASKIPFEYPRQFSQIPLLAETINNIGRIDDPATRDKAGAKMIQLQTNYLSQLAGNWRTAMLVGMLRDSLYYTQDGDAYYWSYDSANTTGQLKTGIPAGNKSKLNMLGAGNIVSSSWGSETTDIPGQILAIHAAFQQLTGSGLAQVMIQSSTWNNMLKNDYIQQAHGTASAPFLSLEKSTENGPDGKPIQVMVGKFNFCPWVDFYVTDEGLNIGKPGAETYKKHVPDNGGIFIGSDVSGGDIECYIGGEPVAEYDGGPKTEKYGMNAWSREVANPTATELFCLDNALIVSHVPQNIAVGELVF